MAKTIILALLLAISCRPGRAQRDTSQSDSGPDQRHQTYVQLNRQIYARHSDPGSGELNASDDKVKSASQQLHDMLSQEIQTALSAPKASETTVVAAISALQGDLSMAGWVPEMNIPFAKFFSLNGTPTVAVGYVILRGGDAIPDTQACLEFYDKSSGVWAEKATAPTSSDFERFTFSLAQLNSGLPGEAWFLAWGVPMGNSVGAEYLRLYAFDGLTVRTVWQRGPLPYGKVTVSKDTVTLEYEDEGTASGSTKQVLHVTPNGLE
jgi:hypothetical protein